MDGLGNGKIKDCPFQRDPKEKQEVCLGCTRMECRDLVLGAGHSCRCPPGKAAAAPGYSHGYRRRQEHEQTTGQPIIIGIEKLNKTYKGIQALKDVNLQVESGELFAFLGPNGATRPPRSGWKTGPGKGATPDDAKG